MRLSSIIVFVAFALLTSASPINGRSRRSNSLWRRNNHQLTSQYRHPDGTALHDESKAGKIVSYLRLRGEGLFMDHYPSFELHNGYKFFEPKVRGLYLRNFYGPEGLELAFLECENGNWMMAYPSSAPPPPDRPNGSDGKPIEFYTTKIDDSTHVQQIFGPHGLEVLSLKMGLNSQWTSSGDLSKIQWQRPPAAGHGMGSE